MEKEIIRLINLHGPLTGNALLEHVGVDILRLWRICRRSKQLSVKTIGRQYLRLDRAAPDNARLSPSIKREFLTYTVVGLRDDPIALERTAMALSKAIQSISRRKLAFARDLIETINREAPCDPPPQEDACFIIAGDIVYNMAHEQPRPESSTGEMIRGSDLDLIVICADGFSEANFKALDQEIYKRKYRLLINPDFREEIDYTIKPMAKVREQLRFDTFEAMVACKILAEGQLMLGSRALFDEAQGLLRKEGIIDRLNELEARGREHRRLAEASLLDETTLPASGDYLRLFYPTQETNETA